MDIFCCFFFPPSGKSILRFSRFLSAGTFPNCSRPAPPSLALALSFSLSRVARRSCWLSETWRRPRAAAARLRCVSACSSITRRRWLRPADCVGCWWSPIKCASSLTWSASFGRSSALAATPGSTCSSTGGSCRPPRARGWCGTTIVFGGSLAKGKRAGVSLGTYTRAWATLVGGNGLPRVAACFGLARDLVILFACWQIYLNNFTFWMLAWSCSDLGRSNLPWIVSSIRFISSEWDLWS